MVKDDVVTDNIVPDVAALVILPLDVVVVVLIGTVGQVMGCIGLCMQFHWSM